MPEVCLDFMQAQLDPRISFTRASIGMAYNSAGVLTSYAVDAPRFDYDPITLACKGLLIEDAATNLLLRSAELEHAGWIKSLATVTPNAIAAPDGTTTADKLVEDSTATNTHKVQQVLSKASSALTYTASICIKAAECTQVVLYLAGSSGEGNAVNTLVDLAAGTVSAPSYAGTFSTGGAATIQSLPNGWYRVAITGTTDTATSVYLTVRLRNGSTTYTGDGTSGVYVWGAQLELGSFASSYIPTTSAQVTRSLDVARVTGANFSSWFNSSEGTVLTEVQPCDIITVASQSRVFADITDGSSTNRVQNRTNSAGTAHACTVNSNYATVHNVAFGSLAANVVAKTAIGYRSGNTSAYGDATASSNSITTYSTIAANQMDLGAQYSGIANSALSGWLRKFVYYRTRLPDGKLQELTT